MVLNIFQKIKDFFIQAVSNISITSVFILITGIIIGFLICALLYLIIVLSSYNKKASITIKQASDIDDEYVNKMITASQNRYIEETTSLNTNKKLDKLKTISYDLIYEIAHVYYPESKFPIYELSIEEILELNTYIISRLEILFGGKITKHIKKINIAQIMKAIDAKKQIDNTKVMKLASKYEVGKITKIVKGALNIVNPVYWIKKSMINGAISIGLKKVAITILAIIGEETAKVYSKHVFNSTLDIDETINEIEQSIQKGEN